MGHSCKTPKGLTAQWGLGVNTSELMHEYLTKLTQTELIQHAVEISAHITHVQHTHLHTLTSPSCVAICTRTNTWLSPGLKFLLVFQLFLQEKVMHEAKRHGSLSTPFKLAH